MIQLHEHYWNSQKSLIMNFEVLQKVLEKEMYFVIARESVYHLYNKQCLIR